MPFFLQCSNASQSRSPIQMWQGLPLGPSMFCSDLQSQSMTQQLTSELYYCMLAMGSMDIYGYLWHNGYPCIMWWSVSVLPRSWDVWASLMQLDAIRTCMDFWHLSCWLKTAGPLRICSSDLSWDCTRRNEKKDSLTLWAKTLIWHDSWKSHEITLIWSVKDSQTCMCNNWPNSSPYLALFKIRICPPWLTFCTDNCSI